MKTNLESLAKSVAILPKKGDEQFCANKTGLGYTLKDFWTWSVSDLVTNITRGRLAEFIVAKALGISTDVVRYDWDSFDLTTPAGLKIEVKSAAYLQSWPQKKLTTIIFPIRKTRSWDEQTNIQSKESKRQADVYVFALLAHTDKPTVDPLNINQWEFYVVPTTVLDKYDRSEVSITLLTLA
jgi:hypothetical protein